jgi:GTP-binding protein HflX
LNPDFSATADLSPARAILVGVAIGRAPGFDETLDELALLAESAGDIAVARVVARRKSPDPALFIGSGKADEIKALVEMHRAEVVLFDQMLGAAQQRNLERALKCKVIDRTALILEIFGRRAQTAEGRLQVELAALEYQKSRLVRSWTHLERQRGGFGFMGGPGESQLELDKRMLGERIQSIRKALFHVQRTRTLQRKARQKVPFPVVALVGYTNAGKSTLFNRLTNAHVRVADLLFATLDPTLRHIHLLSGKKVIVSDTVGFISDLPTTLVAAFRATLEEVVEADVLLHIVDVSHPEWVHQKQDVEKVLAELGRPSQQPIIEVWNKVDQLSDDARASLQQQASQQVAQQASPPVLVSALRGGEGISQLLREIEAICDRCNKIYRIKGSFADGKLWGWLYDNGTIVGNASEEDSYSLDVMLSAKNRARLDTLFPQATVEDLLT